jgi:hypothetical protein
VPEVCDTYARLSIWLLPFSDRASVFSGGDRGVACAQETFTKYRAIPISSSATTVTTAAAVPPFLFTCCDASGGGVVVVGMTRANVLLVASLVPTLVVADDEDEFVTAWAASWVERDFVVAVVVVEGTAEVFGTVSCPVLVMETIAMEAVDVSTGEAVLSWVVMVVRVEVDNATVEGGLGGRVFSSSAVVAIGALVDQSSGTSVVVVVCVSVGRLSTGAALIALSRVNSSSRQIHTAIHFIVVPPGWCMKIGVEESCPDVNFI